MFCVKCGSLIDSSGFKNEDLLRSTEKEIKEFIEKADSRQKEFSFEAPIPGLQGLFDNLAGVRGFLDAFLEQERKNEGNLNKEDQDKHIARLESFVKDCEALAGRDTSFQIAVAGTIKAGKSTLINAILKGQYASVSVTPETAVLTKFRYGERDEITTSFYSEKEWEEFWASATKARGAFMKEYEQRGGAAEKSKWVGHEPITEPLSVETLKKYTSSKSASHYYAKEVCIYLKDFPYEKSVVLVDTPGLNDAVDYRSKVSRDYIKQANVVLLCVSAERLESTAVDTIFRIFDNTGGHPEKVYVLGTKYENLNKPKKDWEEQKVEWTKYLSSDRDNDSVQFTAHLAEKNIIPVSGYIASLLDMYEKGELSKEDREQIEDVSFKLYRDAKFENHVRELRKFSHVDYIHDRIRNDFLDDVEKEVRHDMEDSYEALRCEVGGYFQEVATNLQGALDDASKGVDEIEESIKKGKQEIEALDREAEALNEQMRQFKEDTEELIRHVNETISDVLKQVGS